MTETRIPSIWLWASLILQSLSIAFGKQAAISMESFDLASITTNWFYFLSLTCLGLQALTWQLALVRHPLSFAYFFMTGVFVSVLGLSYFVFDEALTPQNYAGAALIVAGICVMTRPDEATAHA